MASGTVDVIIWTSGVGGASLATGTANAKSITSNEAMSLSGATLNYANASTFNSLVTISAGTWNAGGASSFDVDP